ncbi:MULTISPECIES: hypothetical protein [Fischerella]|uniref:hypothetical protein n=1 Tax=Fischerella TaxID=1190 RepID=UPI001E53507C|nr:MULTISPECIES: hypothetical protein [Fischerella]
MCSLLCYISGDYGDRGTYEKLCHVLENSKSPSFYLAIPPSLFSTVVAGLKQVRCVW